MKKILLAFLLLTINIFAAKIICYSDIPKDRLYCKYYYDNYTPHKVTFKWISPDGKDNRIRTIQTKPGNISVYDYRFLSLREDGIWKVEVIDNNKTTSTKFILKNK